MIIRIPNESSSKDGSNHTIYKKNPFLNGFQNWYSIAILLSLKCIKFRLRECNLFFFSQPCRASRLMSVTYPPTIPHSPPINRLFGAKNFYIARLETIIDLLTCTFHFFLRIIKVRMFLFLSSEVTR